MSKDFDNIVNMLLSQIMGSMKEDARRQCELYLRSACQKHLFAVARLRSLSGRIAYHRREGKVEEAEQLEGYQVVLCPPNRPAVEEMDFDHCVMSLRSSLEHLAQLVNAVIPLNLPSKGKASEAVSLKRVTDEIANRQSLKSIPPLSKLFKYLHKEMDKDWYKQLHDLRIEMFHDKSGRLVRVEILTLGGNLKDLKFLHLADTATGETAFDRDVRGYCGATAHHVKRVLNRSFHYLSRYLSYKLGNAWLQQL